MGTDGGYVRDWDEKKPHFEVIVGKSTLAFRRDEEAAVPSSKCFGFVQAFDTKPKRRLFEVLTSQGLQMNQQITFLPDGGDTVRDLQTLSEPGGRAHPGLVPHRATRSRLSHYPARHQPRPDLMFHHQYPRR